MIPLIPSQGDFCATASQDMFAKQALGSGDEHRDLAPPLRALCCMPQVVVALEISHNSGVVLKARAKT